MALRLSDEQKEQIKQAADVWLASVKPTLAAHLVPIWAVLVDETIFMATEPRSQKVRNILAHPGTVIALPDTRQVLIVEGRASIVEGDTLPAVLEHFQEKYDWHFVPGDKWILIRFIPEKVLSWNSDSDDSES